MKKLFFSLAAILFILSIWTHEPWITTWNWINDGNVHIPERLSLLLSAIIAFLLVLFVEWLRGSSVEFYLPDPLLLPPNDPNRKLLKLGVRVKNRILGNTLNELGLLPSNPHAFASLTVEVNHQPKNSYSAKWDIAPEPREYPHSEQEKISLKGKFQKEKDSPKDFELGGNMVREVSGYPRIEMLPLSLQTANLFPGDKAEASIVAKHDGETNFWIYDPEYYFSKPENRCFLSKAYIKVVFKSSLGRWKSYFCISNTNERLGGFAIEKIFEEEYRLKSKGK